MYQDFIDFVRKTFDDPEGFIILHDPRFVGNERKYIMDAMDSNFVSSVGEYVGKFEEAVARYTGSQYAVAAVNGTSALHICLLLAGVKRDEEVITQPVSFIATCNAIAYTGAHPVFVDVDRHTMGLSPEKLEAFLKAHARKDADGHCYNAKTGRRFAAVVPMHTFGHPCLIEDIADICQRYNIPLVEDSAESIGSLYKGKHTGLFGKLSALSFNGNKVITTGGGGMILTQDEKLAKLAKHITTTAKIPHRWEYNHDYTAYNYRLTNLAAALGLGQIEQCEFFIEQKRKLTDKYKAFFADKEITFFTEPENCRSNYWLNAVILKDRAERDAFLTFTNDHGVMTRPIWVLNNRLDMYKGCQCGDLTNAEWLEDRVVNFSAHKHVRSEKDRYSVEALIENNVLKARKLLDLLVEMPPKHFFCVSTDKAANPVNIMGCSKKVMEEMIMAYSKKFKVCTARFANVAFSNGSLLAGFLERMMKRQPLSSPNDVKRYFVSPEESGQICMLACMLGRSGEIFFPKLGEEQMMTFSSICDKFLTQQGYKIKYCSSEEEARKFAAEMPVNSDTYPVYYFGSDTTGEKGFEEFYIPGEKLNMEKFSSLGVIEEYPCKPLSDIDRYFDQLQALFARPDFTKADVVELLKEFVPNFEHEEKGKNLDQKM